MTITYKNKTHNKSVKNNKTKKNRKMTHHNNQLIIKNDNMCEDISIIKGLEKTKKFYTDLPPVKLGEMSVSYIKKFAKSLLKLAAPKNIKPTDDFYTYINYAWLKQSNITNDAQQYITQVDEFRLIQDKVFKELHEIILDYIHNNNDKLATNMTHFYDSVIKMNKQSETKILAKEIITKIDELRKDKKNVWKMLALVNSDEMLSKSAPLHWYMESDEKEPEIFRCHIAPHHFMNIDLSIYYKDETNQQYKNKQINKYLNVINKVFGTILGPNDLSPNDVFDVAVDMFNSFGCTDLKIKEEKTYNRVYAKEALEKYDFNWDEFCKELGFKNIPPFFITSDLNYLKCCSKLLIEQWDSEKWRSYWIWIYLRKLCRITNGWESIIFDYFGNSEKGQIKINNSNAVSTALYMSIPFNSFLTNQYITKYENKQHIKYTQQLGDGLKLALIRLVGQNTWMVSKTRKYAVYKLNKLKIVIGNSPILEADPLLDYGNSLYKNLKKIYDWRHTKFIELEGNDYIDIPTLDWSKYPVKIISNEAYIVNASYIASKNAIFINVGYLQKPFIDIESQGIEYNLARIGFTIAHELNHAIDDNGMLYDATGKLNTWVTLADLREYNIKTDDIIKQYEVLGKRDGITIDARPTIGENIADICGLRTCMNFLNTYFKANKIANNIQNLYVKIFMNYYAYQMRQKPNKKSISSELKSNPHALSKYRCNIPLSRSIAFRLLYDIKPADDMWWNNMDTIWI